MRFSKWLQFLLISSINLVLFNPICSSNFNFQPNFSLDFGEMSNLLKKNEISEEKMISDEVFYLKNLGGRDVYQLFPEDEIRRIISNSPINPKSANHFLCVTLATSQYLNNLIICLHTAIMHGLTFNQILVISLDKDVYNYFRSTKFQTIYLDYTRVLEANWFVVGRLKQAIQYYFNCFDTDVLFFESDMIICNNFLNEVIDTLNDGVDIQIMEERHEPQKEINVLPATFHYNIGFMMVKSSSYTRILFRRWLYDCYFTKDNLWDQNMFNFIIVNNARVTHRDPVKQNVRYIFLLNQTRFPLTFHFMDPVRYINYCTLIFNEANRFDSNKTTKLIRFAREKNITKPNLLHFACINGPNKFTFMKKIDITQDSYEYHMNYLITFKFVL